jgi:hypothetical protein
MYEVRGEFFSQLAASVIIAVIHISLPASAASVALTPSKKWLGLAQPFSVAVLPASAAYVALTPSKKWLGLAQPFSVAVLPASAAYVFDALFLQPRRRSAARLRLFRVSSESEDARSSAFRLLR